MDQLPKIVAILTVLIALVASATGYGVNACQHRQATAATQARTDRRVAAKAVADSAYYFTQGRRYEVARPLDSLAAHAEVLAPAGYSLPADPPRQ